MRSKTPCDWTIFLPAWRNASSTGPAASNATTLCAAGKEAGGGCIVSGLARSEVVGLGRARDVHELEVVMFRGVHVGERALVERVAQVRDFGPNRTDRLVTQLVENLCRGDVVIAFVERVGDFDFDVEVVQLALNHFRDLNDLQVLEAEVERAA